MPSETEPQGALSRGCRRAAAAPIRRPPRERSWSRVRSADRSSDVRIGSRARAFVRETCGWHTKAPAALETAATCHLGSPPASSSARSNHSQPAAPPTCLRWRRGTGKPGAMLTARPYRCRSRGGDRALCAQRAHGDIGPPAPRSSHIWTSTGTPKESNLGGWTKTSCVPTSPFFVVVSVM